MKVWFMGDVHGGHMGIVKYRTEFTDENHHFQTIKKNFNNLVGVDDKVFFMGDTAFTLERLEDVAGWNGSSKVLIVGNHDTEYLPMHVLCQYFDEVHSMVKYGKKFWLTHAPIHTDELRGRVNIHGHSHAYKVDDRRYVNVCPEHTDWGPIELDQIKRRLNMV